MSILDAAILVGQESTYNTAVSLTRAYEGKADTFTRSQQRIESVGFRADMQTLRSDRVVTVNEGGSGSIEIDAMNGGLGLLMQGCLGTSAGPVQQAATAAYLQTYSTSDAAPGVSYTIQVLRPTLESGSSAFTYTGCVITGWSLTQSTDGLLTITYDFDFANSVHNITAENPAYAANTTPYDWTDCVVTLDPGGTPETLDALDFSLNFGLALKVDRRYLRGSEIKKEPVRNGIPTYDGSIAIDFTGTTRYDEWTSGTVVDLEVKWTGASIESPYNNEIALRMKAINWTDAAPVVSLSDTPRQVLPFRILHDGTNPACTLTYQSADTAV